LPHELRLASCPHRRGHQTVQRHQRLFTDHTAATTSLTSALSRKRASLTHFLTGTDRAAPSLTDVNVTGFWWHIAHCTRTKPTLPLNSRVPGGVLTACFPFLSFCTMLSHYFLFLFVNTYFLIKNFLLQICNYLIMN